MYLMVAILDIGEEGCDLWIRSRNWCIHSTPPGVRQGWPPPRHLLQQMPGFFVMRDQPSRLGKRSMDDGKWVGV